MLKVREAGTGEAVVPLNLQLDRDENCLVITGPNAGGKSVALKTLGLHAMMVPKRLCRTTARGFRHAGVFSRCGVDMGDEQVYRQRSEYVLFATGLDEINSGTGC